MKEKLLAMGKWAGSAVTVGILVLAAALFLRPLIAISLPFLIGYGLAVLVRPLARAICRRSVMPPKVVSVVLTMGSLFLLGAGGFWIVSRLWRELSGLLSYLSNNTEVLGGIADRLDGWLSRFPLPSGALPIDLSALFSEAITGAVSYFSRVIGSFLLRIPSMLLFLIVTVIAAFYFALDTELLSRAVRGMLPPRMREGASRMRRALARGIAMLLRAYAILFAVTLGLLLAGLLLLRVRYALLLAFLLAVFDLLPVLGVGFVLCPWAVSALLLGRTGLAIGLFALWLLVTVVHQALEPRLLGGQLGLHPLLTFFAMYAGLRLLGIAGLIFAPIVAAAVKGALTGDAPGQASKDKGLSQSGI